MLNIDVCNIQHTHRTIILLKYVLYLKIPNDAIIFSNFRIPGKPMF